MSKFQSTISTVAALASIFGAAAAGWKLSEANSTQPPTVLDQKIEQLDKKLEDLSKPNPKVETPTIEPVVVPSQSVATQTPQPVILPPSTPPPPAPTETTP
jgi:hypothetical protein